MTIAIRCLVILSVFLILCIIEYLNVLYGAINRNRADLYVISKEEMMKEDRMSSIMTIDTITSTMFVIGSCITPLRISKRLERIWKCEREYRENKS